MRARQQGQCCGGAKVRGGESLQASDGLLGEPTAEEAIPMEGGSRDAVGEHQPVAETGRLGSTHPDQRLPG